MTPTFSHVRLLVTRFGETFRFYRDVVGLSTTYPDDPAPPYAELELGGDRYLGLFDRRLMSEATAVAANAAPSSDDRVVLCLMVPDVDVHAQQLAARGVEVITPPTDHEPWGMRTIYIRDPEGNLIEFYSGLKGSPTP